MARKRNFDDRLLIELASGRSNQAAAEAAGCSEGTVSRKLADPEFIEKLQALKRQLLRSALERLTGECGSAVETLAELARPGNPPGVRQAAATKILELRLKWMEVIDHEERLAALEGLKGTEA